MQNFALNQSSAIRYVLFYALALFGLAFVIYYLPDYTILEAMVAEHSAGILNAIGVPAGATIASDGAYVNNVRIVRECTGIQVVAVFVGLLLPLPKVSWQVKLKAIVVLGFAVYVANVIRVAVELWLLYAGIMPWSMAHGPFGTVLGVITVFLFFLVSDRFIPQIGVTLGRITDRIVDYFRNRRPIK